MNRNFILLVLLVLFAGCTGFESGDNLTQVKDNLSLEQAENSSGALIVEGVKSVEPQEVVEKAVEPEVKKEEPKKEIVEKKVVEEPEKEDSKLKINIYKYPFEINGKTTNIQMYNTLEQLEENNFKIGITKDELLDTETFDLVFNSKASSNGAVVKVSGRLYPVLSILYGFPMEALENIVYSDEISCADSTLERKLVMFDSDYSSNEVLYDGETGCIQFKTTSQDNMGTLGDKFFYELFSD
jgi:hypothetical protein